MVVGAKLVSQFLEPSRIRLFPAEAFAMLFTQSRTPPLGLLVELSLASLLVGDQLK